jgi:4-amino-4-deoxy-L-arabinose transferase-like glycosyltransferase
MVEPTAAYNSSVSDTATTTSGAGPTTPPGGLDLFVLPVLTLLFQLITYRGYGYFRDELYYLANARHLGFGYVEHPPFIALVTALVRTTLGDSLFAIRLFPALAAAATVWLTMRLARELGGGRYARLLAGVSVAVAPGMLGLFSVLSMNAFDLVFWAAAFLLVAFWPTRKHFI